MASPESSTARRWLVFRTAGQIALMAFALGVSAFILAQWPQVHRTGVDELETVNIGLNLLIAGGIPWLLQWASLALLFILLAGRLGYLQPRTMIAVALIPLAVGVCWWMGVGRHFQQLL